MVRRPAGMKPSAGVATSCPESEYTAIRTFPGLSMENEMSVAGLKGFGDTPVIPNANGLADSTPVGRRSVAIRVYNLVFPTESVTGIAVSASMTFSVPVSLSMSVMR